MSVFVLDSSTALKWVLPEPDSDKALALRDDYQSGIHHLLAPDVFPIEVAHALARAERRKIIVPPEGAAKLADVLKFRPQLHRYLPLLPRAFDIASQMHVGVYDCLYVALAEREQCAMVTADVKLLANLQSTFPFLKSLSSMP